MRLGRSLIINQTYLTEISVTRQRVTLSDYEANTYPLSVPKPLLKQYKERIGTMFAGGARKRLRLTKSDNEYGIYNRP